MKAEEGKLPRVTMKNRAKVAQSGPGPCYCGHWVVDVASAWSLWDCYFRELFGSMRVFSAVIAPQGPEVIGG